MDFPDDLKWKENEHLMGRENGLELIMDAEVCDDNWLILLGAYGVRNVAEQIPVIAGF